MNVPRPAIMSFLRALIVAAGSIGAVVSVQADPVVSNLTATQRAGTKLVDITFDLDAPGFGAVAVTLEASSDGGTTWTVPVTSATGAVGASVTPGTSKAIVWNAGVDWPLRYSTQMRFRVVADDGFALIPGGSFTMGRTSGDADADAPPIMVTVSPFYIQQTETTKAQWDEVRTWGLANGYTDIGTGAGTASNHPVQTVSWLDAVKWCNARSEKEGLTPVFTVSGAVMRTGTTPPVANWSANGYRLPTEAEWEKAARGGVSGKRFPWGTDTISHAQANYYGSSEYVYDQSPINNYHPNYRAGGFDYTSPVGSFEANGYGLYDMAGNVWEWCWDRYESSYYTTSNGTTDPRGHASGPSRVIRGGGWMYNASSARCATRGAGPTGTALGNAGFRPARNHPIDGMPLIPGGSFTMGRTSGDADADAPPIMVTVSPFYIQQTETTKAQWDEVRTWAVNNSYTDLAVGEGKASNHPVQMLSWWDVVKWCNARSEKEGLTPAYSVSGEVMRTGQVWPEVNWSANGYRLPTEAEWEKAARGGVSEKRFPWGADTISHAQANYYGSVNDGYDQSPIGYHPSYTAVYPYTSPVGNFPANGYGLYDMAGNVQEWCWDLYSADYYSTSNRTTDPRGMTSGINRGVRGGAWQSGSFYVRCAFRGNTTPGATFNYIGFRSVRSSLGSSISQTESLDVDTRDAPTVSTPTATSITATGATLGGNVTSDGGAMVTERGVVYSATGTNADPLIGGTGVTKVTATGTTGNFTVPVTGLTQSTGYSYRAYAINSQGTTYTTVATFTTLSANADLSAMTLSSVTLSSPFASNTIAYTASVSNATTSITVTPTRAQANATIKARVNTGTYAAVTSGSPSASLPLNVGSNTVDVRVTAQDGTTQKTYTVTVTRDKAAQTITLANPGAQLANATVNLSATGGTSGNPVTFTVEGPATLVGNVLSFTGADSVTVRANQAGNDLYHPAPEVSRTFTVSKATATVMLGNLSQTYDSKQRPVSATTNPSGRTVILTYDDSTTAPTGAGSYIVIGTINDPIYEGSTSSTLFIAKAAQTITFAPIPAQLATNAVTLSASGGESGQSLVFVVESGPAVLREGNILTFTGAGEVRVRASQAGNSDFNPADDVTHTFDVVLPQPDVAVGLALDSLVGTRGYGNSGQQLNLVSRFARPVTGFAILANRTILSDRRAADRLAVRANPGNRFFRVTYSDVDGNATAGIVSGFYRTPEIDGTDAIRWLTARISPNRALLAAKKGRRTVYLRKTFKTTVRASSTLYPPASDSGVIRVSHL
jgi:sulfatase modifying factor 1